MNHWNRIFWAFFIFIGLVIIFGTLFQAMYVEVLLGLVVIILGIQKLGDEKVIMRLEDNQAKVNRSMDYMIHWSNTMHDYVKNMKGKHDFRLHNMDSKRAELEKKTEDNYRDLVRKIVDIENHMNELAYAGVITKRPEIRSGRGEAPKTRIAKPSIVTVREEPTPKPPQGDRLAELSERQIGAIKVIRSRGKISTKEYTTLFKVSDRTAQNDLKDMMKKNLIRKRGKGASTHYVMGF